MLAKEVFELDERYVMQCFPRRDELVVVRAKGAKITDISGREYLDLFSGIAVANVGHCHPRVMAAIKEQAERYMHVSNYYYNDVAPRLAERIARVAPGGLGRTFFTNSGTEAVDGAVKLAKKYAYMHCRNGMVLISLEGSFHGRLSLPLTLTGQKKYKEKLGHYACYPGVVYAPPPYHYRYGGVLDAEEFGKKCAEDMADLLDNYAPGEVAAVIAEPVMGEGGIIVPPDTYLPRVQRICRERQVLLVIDEVQTGIARTGRMFACEHWGLEPDIMTVAKALGGGLPIGAFMAREDVASAFEEGDHFSTFGGNPVSCAAAIAVLDIVRDEHLVERASQLGDYAMKRLREIGEGNSLIGEVRGKGLMIGVELVKDRRSKEPAEQEAARLKEEMRRRGFLIGLGGIRKNVLRIQPPLVILREEIDSALEAFQGSLKVVQKA